MISISASNAIVLNSVLFKPRIYHVQGNTWILWVFFIIWKVFWGLSLNTSHRNGAALMSDSHLFWHRDPNLTSHLSESLLHNLCCSQPLPKCIVTHICVPPQWLSNRHTHRFLLCLRNIRDDIRNTLFLKLILFLFHAIVWAQGML